MFEGVSIFLGDTDQTLIATAKRRDPSAVLVSSNNFLNLSAGTYYTSIGYLDSLRSLGIVLQQAQEITYVPPESWSHEDARYWTEDYLKVFSCDSTKKIIGFTPVKDPLSQACQAPTTSRQAESQQLWVVGCSISHGVGIAPEHRYGDILSAYFHLPVTYLTKPGSSIPWAADQILRSDIREGDKIFWGLTELARFSYWDEQSQQVKHCTANMYRDQKTTLDNLISPNWFVSDNVKYEAIKSVYQVNNFCKKLHAELVIATLMRGMETFINGIDTFLPLDGLYGRDANDRFLDLGQDKIHPGIKTHQMYADSLWTKHQSLYGS